MKYLVMECGLSYVIVLDEEGRFLKAANLGYQVGETLDHIIPFAEPHKQAPLSRKILSLGAVAACLCLITLLAFQYILLPVGSVRMQINPDLSIEINRLNYVIGLEPLNDDGEALIDGYSYAWKNTETVSDELADLAMERGYLQEGGNIRLTVESDDDGWKTATEEKILTELEIHLHNRVTVTISSDDEKEPQDAPTSQPAIVIDPNELVSEPREEPSSPSSSSPAVTGNHDDDDDDDDDDNDDNDDDDETDDSDDDDDKPSVTAKPTSKPTLKPTPKPTVRPTPKPDDDDSDDDDDDDNDDSDDDNDDSDDDDNDDSDDDNDDQDDDDNDDQDDDQDDNDSNDDDDDD